jgi:hypothetical protein
MNVLVFDYHTSVNLREETDLYTLNGELVGMVRETMQPSHIPL